MPTHMPMDKCHQMAGPYICVERKCTLLPAEEVQNAMVMETGRAGFRDVSPVQLPLGPTLRRAPSVAECSQFHKTTNNFWSWGPICSFLTGPCKSYG